MSKGNNNHWLVNRILADKDRNGPGMLLNADKVWESKTGQVTDRAVFKLHSDRLQKEFVTLWELFDEPQDFERCVSELAEAAKEIRQQTPFTSIITCTPTARHITDHLHSKIEGDREKVDVQYLWHHPFFTLDGKPLSGFDNNEGVLIVTDVVATGNLAAQMAEMVERLGGNPVAILAVVLVDADLAIDRRIPYQSIKPTDKGSEKTEYLPLRALASYPINGIAPENVDKSFDRDKILSIDPRTVLPKDPDPARLFDFQAKFDEYEMLEQFDGANALQYGFFAADGSKFTIAVNFDRVLSPPSANGSGDNLPDLLWEKVWREVSDCFRPSTAGTWPTLVTTFDAEDLHFKDFIEQRLRALGKRFEKAYISKHDASEWASGYFVLPQHAQKLADRRVILALASVHSSEKLRNLASLLASYSAASINVVCLLNRMGTATRNFMLRIENLLRGLGSAPDGHADFIFTYLYSLIDIDSDDIEKAQAMVDSLLSDYKRATRVSSFRRLVEQDRNYFRFRTTTSHEFQTYTSPMLRKPFPVPISASLDRKPIFLKTQAAEAALFVGYLIETRDFTPLIAEISRIATMPVVDLLEKRSLFHTYAVLLCHLGYLKVGNALGALREALRKSIKGLRDRRLQPQPPEDSAPAEQFVAREADLLFGLALFSYLERDEEVEKLINEALFCDRSATQWLSDPRSLLLHFGEERMSYVVSLALHLSNPRFREPDAAASLKGRLVAKITDLLKTFHIGLTDEHINIERGKELRSRTLNNLHFLLKEMEGGRRLSKLEIVRHLHHDLVYTKIDHSPMVTGLWNVDTAMVKFLNEVHPGKKPTSGMASFAGHDLQRDLSEALEDAIYSIGLLEDIVDSIRGFLVFTRCDWSKAQDFAAERGSPGLAETLWVLGDLLQSMRMDKQLSWTQYGRVLDYRSDILERIWDPESYLRQLLLSYISPLHKTIVEAMESAEEELGPQFKEVWMPEIKRRREKMDPQEEVYVLFWKSALFEVLKNLFTNVRHSLLHNSEKPSVMDDVALTVGWTEGDQSHDSGGTDGFWTIQVDSFGKPLNVLPLSCTLRDQGTEVREMGGELEISKIHQSDKQGARATLILRSRKPIPEPTPQIRRSQWTSVG